MSPIRKYQTLALLVLMAVGCGRKAPPKAEALAPPDSLDHMMLAPPPEVDAGVFNGPMDGRPAPALAQYLESRNPHTQARAAVALGRLGEQGYPHLVQGMQSKSEMARLVSTQAIGVQEMTSHAQETTPLLLRMLASDTQKLRVAAAGRLGWFSSPEIIAALANAAKTDEDADVRRTAEIALGHIALRTVNRTPPPQPTVRAPEE